MRSPRRPNEARDYKAEYGRRLERARARGLTKSQARGHPKPGEAALRPKVEAAPSDEKLEQALRALRATGNQKVAAKTAHVSPERFRRFLRQNKLARRKGRGWRITDRRRREVVVITTGGRKRIRIGLCETPLPQIYSEASLGKGSLRAMGIRSWGETQPDFPPEILGHILASYFGGRSEVRVRRELRQVEAGQARGPVRSRPVEGNRIGV